MPCINKYVLKQEKPEMDEFERINLGSKGIILLNFNILKMLKILKETLAKRSHNTFAHF